MSQTTEWKQLRLSDEKPDFSGALRAHLECGGDQFIALTLKLRNGRTIRIRKNDYSICIEEPVIPTITKYLAKTEHGLERLFDEKEKAEEALLGVEGEVKEVIMPVGQLDKELLF